MSFDSLVDEVRTFREAYAEQFDYDLEAIFRHLKERQKKSGRKLVSLVPKRLVPAGTTSSARPTSR